MGAAKEKPFVSLNVDQKKWDTIFKPSPAPNGEQIDFTDMNANAKLCDNCHREPALRQHGELWLCATCGMAYGAGYVAATWEKEKK